MVFLLSFRRSFFIDVIVWIQTATSIYDSLAIVQAVLRFIFTAVLQQLGLDLQHRLAKDVLKPEYYSHFA